MVRILGLFNTYNSLDYLCNINDMTRGFVLSLLVGGFIIWWAFVAIYGVFDFSKRMSSKQGRTEIGQEISSTAKFIAKDKDFHKSIFEEFRGTFIMLGLVLFIMVLYLLGADI